MPFGAPGGRTRPQDRPWCTTNTIILRVPMPGVVHEPALPATFCLTSVPQAADKGRTSCRFLKPLTHGCYVYTIKATYAIFLGHKHPPHLNDAAAGGLQIGHLPWLLVILHRAMYNLKRRCTWTTRQPDASRSATSPRSASASWKACVRRDTSLRGNDQFRMVTGPAQHSNIRQMRNLQNTCVCGGACHTVHAPSPVSMPLTGFLVRPCAKVNSLVVMAVGRDTSSWISGGRTAQRGARLQGFNFSTQWCREQCWICAHAVQQQHWQRGDSTTPVPAVPTLTADR